VSFLLDTSVISELVKPSPDDNVVKWLKRAEEADESRGAKKRHDCCENVAGPTGITCLIPGSFL